MTSTPTTPQGRRIALTPRVAFWLQASVLAAVMGGSSAPTPLYPVYQAMWGFSPIILTVAFAVYALALLAALLTVGSLSDHLGRRPVLLAALLLEVVTMVVFAAADSATALIAARIVQGLATGAALGALGAYLIELEPRNRPGLGTVINSAGPILGLAVGAVASSIVITFAPGSIHAIYVVILGLLVIQILGTALSPETVRPAPGALASLRPRVHLPQSARRAAIWVLPAAVSTWALGGLILSLGPIVVQSMAGSGSTMLGGLIVAALTGTGGVAVLLVGSWAPRRLLTLGMVTLLASMATTMVAVGVGSLPLYFVATVIAGVGFGRASSACCAP
ncbi:MFS transporter [Prescottella defluvii]|nr:MFS transporter [Prescottella defluvii]